MNQDHPNLKKCGLADHAARDEHPLKKLWAQNHFHQITTTPPIDAPNPLYSPGMPWEGFDEGISSGSEGKNATLSVHEIVPRRRWQPLPHF